MDSKPNIIFITFDSGRADHMGFLGYDKPTTPFMDSLAKKGTYFKRAYSTGPGSSVSFVGMFTSTYPLDHGGYSYIDKPRVLLSEVLKDNGYKTVGIHSSPYLSSYFGYDRGWDDFRYLTHFGSKKKKNSGSGESGKSSRETDGVVMSAGLRKGTIKADILKKSASTYRWLKKYLPPLAIIYRAAEKLFLLLRKILKDIVDFRQAFYTADEMNEEVRHAVTSATDKPLFLWLHYLDAHGPYALFARKKGSTWLRVKYYLGDVLAFLFGDTPFFNRLFTSLYINLYDESLRYVDEHMKQLLEYLKSLGINDDNSVVVICADHGEVFSEHNSFGHSQLLFDVNIHVPLLFYGPRYLPKSSAEDGPVSLIDVSPTILSFAGIPPPTSYKGKNLFAEDNREVVSFASESEGDLSGAAFTGISIIYNGYKLVYWKDKKYLFSLDDEEEKLNLYETKKDIVAELVCRVEKYKPEESV